MTDHETDRAENRPPLLPLVLWPGASPIYVPSKDADEAVALLKGERALLPEPGEPDVRRVLDLCPGAGEFSVYCRLRFPVAWVDLLARDDDEAAICSANAAPGARVLREFPKESYDLVRTGTPDALEHLAGASRTQIVFIDGGIVSEIRGFELAAQGMRAKGRGFQWWVRRRE